jgi:hypothetical protein
MVAAHYRASKQWLHADELLSLKGQHSMSGGVRDALERVMNCYCPERGE